MRRNDVFKRTRLFRDMLFLVVLNWFRGKKRRVEDRHRVGREGHRGWHHVWVRVPRRHVALSACKGLAHHHLLLQGLEVRVLVWGLMVEIGRKGRSGK